MKKSIKYFLIFMFLFFGLFVLVGCESFDEYLNSLNNTTANNTINEVVENKVVDTSNRIKLTDIPAYTNTPYVEINNNVPFFNDNELVTESYEKYSSLDKLGRAGVAIACIEKGMDDKARTSVSGINPTGWQDTKYEEIDGNNLYNRCHLIANQLTGENANNKNLITGTRYMNTQGMERFENQVAEYINNNENKHVLYRVTPMYENENLVANGVLIEAKSVEDKGKSIQFNVFCYNVQPGIEIDYKTGNSKKIEEKTKVEEIVPEVVAVPEETSTYEEPAEEQSETYILNTNTKKFHHAWCSSVSKMKDKIHKEENMEKEKNKFNLSWPKVIIFAIIAGVYTAIMAILPMAKDTSFADITISFEVWILFGIIIIMNSKSAKDSALKCFVFFLISQPLVYLIQVPFTDLGFEIFVYYRFWFIWTLLTIPMGFIGYFIKKDKWWGLLILTPVLLFLGVHYLNFLGEVRTFFPKHLLSMIFCIVTIITYPIVMFKNKRIRIAGAIISILIIIAATVVVFINGKTAYNTTILVNNGSQEVTFDNTYKVYLTDESFGKVYIKYDENLKDYMVNAEFVKLGKTDFVVESPNGEKITFEIDVKRDSFELTRK